MSREITFRGISKETKQFIYGIPLIMTNTDNGHQHFFIIPDDTDVSRGQLLENVLVEVIPETVGQYTGLKDNKRTDEFPEGQKIYNGDIVSFTDGHDGGYYGECLCVGKVVWDEETLSFQVTDRVEAESYEVLSECIVIGNIYNNPKLLEGEEK